MNLGTPIGIDNSTVQEVLENFIGYDERGIYTQQTDSAKTIQ